MRPLLQLNHPKWFEARIDGRTDGPTPTAVVGLNCSRTLDRGLSPSSRNTPNGLLLLLSDRH
jgi:hypothetical protein